jgi:hypothetical protein
MSFIFVRPSRLVGKDKVGSHHCVAFVQEFASTGHTSGWREGDAVLGNKDIQPGTAIATFVNGKYRNNSTGNHAALFVRHDVNGFWVVDQYKDKDDGQVRPIDERLIRATNRNQRKDGSWPNASNNAYAYSVIE